MDTTELILLLMETPEIGEKTTLSVLRRNAQAGRSADDFMGLSQRDLAQEYGIRRSIAVQILDSGSNARIDSLALHRVFMRAGVRVVTIMDATYPVRLLDRMQDPPPVLLAYGNHALLNDRLFAVANSNGAREEALLAGDRAAEAALKEGWSLATGHNRVAWQRPALVMRRNGGRVCYVLDRGMLPGFGGDLSRALFTAARIWGPAYDPSTDLTLSCFAPRAHGIAANNRRRDALIFALADIIMAGEIRTGGQMERECIAALRRGQRVLLCGAKREADSLLLEAGAQRTDIDSLSRILSANR